MKYVVTIKEVHFATFHVEANSVGGAISQAEEMHNDEPGELEYSETLSQDQWGVYEKK